MSIHDHIMDEILHGPHVARARRLEPLPPPPVDPWWRRLWRWLRRHPAPAVHPTCLLIPEGAEITPALDAERERLGATMIVEPHQGQSRMHRRAHRAGHDVSAPVLYRHQE